MRTLFAIPLLVPVLLVGCGGHGGTSSTSSSASTTTSVGKGKGKAVLRVKWPARTSARLIPNAANEITVNLLQGTTVVAVAKIPRPASGSTTTSTTLTGLAYGAYTVWVQAFPSSTGTGTAQAYGGGSMTVTEDTPGSLGVSLDSSVVALAIVPAVPAVGPGRTTVLTASATDAGGNVVLLSAGGGTESLTWTSDDPAIATVSGTGPTATLTGVALGTARVTASLRMDDAGDVVSTTPTAVSVVTPSVVVSGGGTDPFPDNATLKFAAAVTGLSDPSVTWTASVGSVAADGTYTPALGTDTTVTITATSIADPTVLGTTTIFVKPVVISPRNVTINYVDGKPVPSSVQFSLRGSKGSPAYGSWSGANESGLYTAPKSEPGRGYVGFAATDSYGDVVPITFK